MSLILLRDRELLSNSDVTLYIKGFFSRNHGSEHFTRWLETHNSLVIRKGWGTNSYGWNWESGSITTVTTIPVPWTTLSAFAWNAIKYTSRIARITPVGLATTLAVDVGINLSLKYWKATHNTDLYAKPLAQALIELYDKNHSKGKIRVIAHSLGCKLLINALDYVPVEQRPHEIHLCAPALTEEKVKTKLPVLGKKRTFIYYCNNDTTLQLGYPLLNSGEDAIGYIGLKDDYENVYALDVGHYFSEDYLVHRQYSTLFHKFAGMKPNDMLPHEKELLIPKKKVKEDKAKEDKEKEDKEKKNEKDKDESVL